MMCQCWRSEAKGKQLFAGAAAALLAGGVFAVRQVSAQKNGEAEASPFAVQFELLSVSDREFRAA